MGGVIFFLGGGGDLTEKIPEKSYISKKFNKSSNFILIQNEILAKWLI